MLLRAWAGILLAGGLLAGTETRPDELAPGVRLEAGGVPIDTGQYSGHAGPLFADYDRDGLPDLLVGNLRGHIQVYRNVGTRKAPLFEDRGRLQAEGKPVRLPNW